MSACLDRAMTASQGAVAPPAQFEEYGELKLSVNRAIAE